ncbi:MAG: galactose mutarotase, partial [Desulfovibrio sp.]
HQLHGGPQGFNSRVWAADAAYTRQGPSLALSLVSPDGDQGYPGELRVTAVYTLAEDALLLEFLAEADQPTPVNLTHHAYFNLTADTGADCLGHQLTLRSSQYLATDPAQIPTGEVKDVGGTPFDFRGETAIGERVAADDEDIRYGKGYDHCFVLDNDGKTSERAARVREPVSGRVLELYTDMACVQFYSGNHLPPNTPGRDGAVYTTHSGFCLEPQGYVDAPNQPGFPQVTLRPEEKFRARVQFRVTTEPGKG